MLAKPKYSWRFVTAAPPREIFASMEQLIGSSPYQYEVTGVDSARVIEYTRRGFFGQWSRPRVAIRWVSCRATVEPVGSRVEIQASSAGGMVFLALGKLDRGPQSRALQMVRLLTSGAHDPRTIYRERWIPPGPVTLVASWAGMRYRLFAEPHYDSARGAEILTASELEAIPGGNGPFVHVRLKDGTEGYVERDQIAAAPGVSTREAQLEAARFV